MSGTSAELATLSRWVSEKSPGYQQSFRPDPGRLGGEARKEDGERCVRYINSSASLSPGCLPDRDLRLRADRHIP